MKTTNIVIAILSLLLISACNTCPQSKNRTYRETRFKNNQSSSFIPLINGSITFHADSGKTLVFDQVTTSHNFTDQNQCETEECCHHIVNVETNRLLYISTKVNLQFQCSMYSGDVTDLILFVMSKETPADNSDFASSIFYVNHIDINNIFNHSDTNCAYIDRIILRNKVYTDIYNFKGSSTENKKFAESVYSNKTVGIVGFKLNDKSIWTKD